ncbi:MAG: aldo/keto reductase [Actinobacteria bacterium]|uniref:Unannotated protein n=1 Tax=freshwater metagenome TaxID=449393 RepID=A0A6J7J659_9ZZZZ|nr:aldo/keto reductase [Actinomycetota bacterium]
MLRLLPGTDLMVHPLCLGGNVFGWGADRDESFAVLDAYADAGGNFIDTADTYSSWQGTDGGESETIIGDWMVARGNRDSMIIATKVGKAPKLNNLRPETITTAMDLSLQRLRTDRVDLYYAHQDHDDPMPGALEAFDSLVRSGKARYLAASNYSPDRLAEALELAAANNWAPFVALQPGYNLMQRPGFEDALMPFCLERGVGTLPYYGLARGYLTGKYRLGGPEVTSVRAAAAATHVDSHGESVLQVVERVAQRHGVSMGSVALGWLASRPTVVAPIASARTVQQLADMLPMATLELSNDDLDELTAVSGSIS